MQQNQFSFFQNSRFHVLNISFPFFMAPMVGISHLAFRELIKSYVPTGLNMLRYTEMLSTRRIPNEKLDSTNELKIAPNEDFFIPQLLGNEEKFIAPSIEKLMKKNPWGFDINMGCSVSHTLKHNWGVRLMGDRIYAAEIVRITKKHSPVPVSVKIRGGIDSKDNESYLFDFAKALEDAGADFITIHARTREQKHSGEAHWALVGQVQKQLSIPVIANGNIQTSADASSVLNDFCADGAMIARAGTARPWLPWQIAEELGYSLTPIGYEGKKAPRTPEEEGKEYGISCLRLIQIFKTYFSSEDYILEKFRFFIANGSRWFQFGHYLWKLSMRSKSVQELENSLYEFFEKHENLMTQKIRML